MSVQTLHTGITICRWPIIGYVVVMPDGKRHYDWPDSPFDVSVQWREPEGWPIRVYLGHPATGPLAVIHSGGTDNPDYANLCWSKGSGGNWSSWPDERTLKGEPSWKTKPTLRQAFTARCDRSRFSDKRLAAEPPELTAALLLEFSKLDTAMPKDGPDTTLALQSISEDVAALLRPRPMPSPPLFGILSRKLAP